MIGNNNNIMEIEDLRPFSNSRIQLNEYSSQLA
jgi:hypothetical protein